MFDPYSIDLPVTEIIADSRKHLAQTNTLIVHAPPGAGKSTLLPLALMDEPWLEGKKILMLEPRRLAARTISARMSELLGTAIGQEVGYRIRFDNKISKNTRIEVLTEGILTRMLQDDNALEGVGMVIFDEFHERSIFADTALALCREAQEVLRPDLRIVVMSATLDLPQLTTKLGAPLVSSQGRQYPVQVIYAGQSDVKMLPEMVARTVVQAAGEHEGDILVFLPGQGEIIACEGLLRRMLPGTHIHPLYGMLPPAKQHEALMPRRDGGRKVVIATSIAETSLTIEGVRIVVDCGYGRASRFDPNSGLSRLETIQISKDSADQRAGRAGRLSAGVCYRMWTAATHDRLADHRVPEIAEADLADLVLDMAQWGVSDIQKLVWLTPPPAGHVAQATELLQQLDALDDTGKITPHGRKLHRLPCHPRIAHMLICAQADGAESLACDVAALLEERDPMGSESGIDLSKRIEALRRNRRDNRGDRRWDRIEQIAESYHKLLNTKIINASPNPYEVGVVLTHAFPERIACARPGNNAQFQLANGRIAMASHKDDLAFEPWLAVAQVDARDGMGKIFLAAPLNPRDLAPLVKKQTVTDWDTKKGGFVAAEELRIGTIILQTKPIQNVSESLRVAAICRALKKEGRNLLEWDEDAVQWQHRILSLQKWNGAADWPAADTDTLLQTADQWLAPYLGQVRKTEELKKIDLRQALHYSLTPQQQSELARLAPERLPVPSGSDIRIKYHANGDSPELAVRLQEMFGLAETPRVNGGKIPVVLHLLSPGFKPVQVTSDLSSFWNNAYFEVKKELKRRYPKHVWPDDPWTEPAISGARRRKPVE